MEGEITRVLVKPYANEAVVSPFKDTIGSFHRITLLIGLQVVLADLAFLSAKAFSLGQWVWLR